MIGIRLKLWQNIASSQALFKYCGLDTLAMIKGWEKLREVSE